jgi:anthranilate/para-aminobenzoate synthase component II
LGRELQTKATFAAENEETPVAFSHQRVPFHGVLFHPKSYSNTQNGKRLLRQFVSTGNIC